MEKVVWEQDYELMGAINLWYMQIMINSCGLGTHCRAQKNLAVTILMHIFDCWNIPLVKSVSIILQYYYTFKCFKEAHKKYWAQTIYKNIINYVQNCNLVVQTPRQTHPRKCIAMAARRKNVIDEIQSQLQSPNTNPSAKPYRYILNYETLGLTEEQSPRLTL